MGMSSLCDEKPTCLLATYCSEIKKRGTPTQYEIVFFFAERRKLYVPKMKKGQGKEEEASVEAEFQRR